MRDYIQKGRVYMIYADCGIIVPRVRDIFYSKFDGMDFAAECILPRCHSSGIHIFRTPEGELYEWEYNYFCGCCEPEEDERCYAYVMIDRIRFSELVNEALEK